MGTLRLVNNKKGFGTGPVFFTAISTILGAILFLRFGYAIGNVGLLGAWAIIILGHMVTIPTALAIAEIATNQKVEGGGEYFIISRSFGLTVGGAIGVALYLSQAISVAFYIIAFAQAFEPVFHFLLAKYAIYIYDFRIVSIPALLILIVIMVSKGATLGIKTLYVVVAVLGLALVFLFLGGGENPDLHEGFSFNKRIENPSPFFYVFAICFPAFTGMTAGVGLSGDLKDPKRSIPRGTVAATLIGMLVYMAIAYKLYISASPEDLDAKQFIMSDISLWGPIIPIGLAAATISSALGSIMVAPRTLQALASDKSLPLKNINHWLSLGKGKKSEPINATLITSVIALVFVIIGDVNTVAGIITMFFMMTYGSICMISFFEHFASDPSYRPSFRSKWYFSLLGAVMCLILMFQISPRYALLAMVFMTILYFIISRTKNEKEGLAGIFQGVIFQLSRVLQVFLQKVEKDPEMEKWRPSVVCISEDTFKRVAAFELLGWISHRYGFGTYIHLIDGYLSKETHQESRDALKRLIDMAEVSKNHVFLDTLISPSYTSAIAQVIQLPGISGKENNMILFEYTKENPLSLKAIVENYQLTKSSNFDVLILGSSSRRFGLKSEIHLWITPNDFQNANLMILMAYIIIGHPDWKRTKIKIFAMFPVADLEKEKEELLGLVQAGRIPISASNIRMIPKQENEDSKTLINNTSKHADLSIMGFRGEIVRHEEEEVFKGFEQMGDILFVNTNTQKIID
jgi:amino acid transporter